MKRMAVWIATGFGLGLSPFASGTVGSLLGIPLAIALAVWGPVWWIQLALCLVLALVAVPVCDVAERVLGRKDDGRIVADEYLIFPLCLVGIPWLACPWFLAVAFVINRILDIIKPPPARQIQQMHGGAGIVLDDLISTAYTLGINHLLWAWLFR
ncbi:MAG: hypothetical protein A2498_14040 [Lentisphaerae bacterium RIFOXYC12_FULL_60_16]|nr:MAG: hypothetical protein A2498_14040 [Lentisphaerae bacterium RIFOXYC12_FULL_60_16]OGV74619.1 MAG: hypothetical protein A2269_02290 [Lentisphaerae bacterium RIFOXYA12_FULL_60_10]OGV86427.1 MAG: hypothetical protein A2340_02865 [Lentisphaerae bacterium RIFOXYB12_FULL_60_10]